MGVYGKCAGWVKVMSAILAMGVFEYGYIYIYIYETCAWTPNNVFWAMIVVGS